MSLTVPAILKYFKVEEEQDEDESAHPRSKKRRLNHLTWEEKLQRKKLKNRVAAQTSRDRKKQRMEQMESAIQELFLKNESFLKECKKLRDENKRLSQENVELRKKLNEPCNDCLQNRSVECDVRKRSTESYPLPKGPETHSAATLKTQTVTAVWKIVLACLLYQTFSMNSTTTSTTLNRWSKLHKASYKISPQIWKQLLKKQIFKNQQLLKDQDVLQNWWGRHQNSWTPIDAIG